MTQGKTGWRNITVDDALRNTRLTEAEERTLYFVSHLRPHPVLALARKYRPRNFASVAVQSHVSNTLKGAIARGRVAHGYLFCGPRGTGKTTLARVLAMALNCENRGAADAAGEPCGECISCMRIWRGDASLDVVEIDAASNRGVDDARELRERAMYAPSGDDRYKVYIVDEAHMLTREAWNALLKVLEEPPPRVVFVFATTEPQKIQQTAAPVLSRLQRFDLKRIGPADVRARLAEVLGLEGVTYDADALAMIARAADGSMRDALSLTDQALAMGDGRLTAERVRDALGLVPEDEYLALLDIIAEARAADVFPAIGRLADAGIDFGSLLTGLADVVRAQLAVALGGEATDVSERLANALVERKDRLASGDLLRMLNALAELEQRFKKSGQQQLLLETVLVRLAMMDRTIALEDVLRGLAGGGASGAGTGAPGRTTKPVSRETPQHIAPVRRADVAPDVTPVAPADLPPQRERSEPTPPKTSLSANALAEHWDAIVERVKSEGRAMLAAALANTTPVGVSAQGVITIQLDDPDEIRSQALESGRNDILGAVRSIFDGVERVIVRAAEVASSGPPKRITDESVRTDRVTSLRKRDPVLGAAVDALDLELLD
jgi:DNA polymerase-3 subunit gamma/tau